MQTKLLTTVALTSILNFSLAGAIAAQPVTIQNLNIAQNHQHHPAKTYKPGFWQPAARVDINRPIVIKLINETDVTLNYDLTTNIEKSPEQLEPGKETSFKDFPIPVYLLINPDASVSNTSEFNLKYDVVVDDNNTAIVRIRKVAEGTPGNTTLNLHETGAIYIY
jgi:hypothetical protein